MTPEIILRGHRLADLKFLGYWDGTFFCNGKESSGILFETESGERLKISYAEINKAKKEIQK